MVDPMVCRGKGHEKRDRIKLTMSRVMTQMRGHWRLTALWGLAVHQHGRS